MPSAWPPRLFRYLDTGGYFAEAITSMATPAVAAQQTGDRAAEADALISLGYRRNRAGHQQRPDSSSRPWPVSARPGDRRVRPAR